MQIKQPAAYDVSHWKLIPDFKLVSPKPSLFITKATEAHPNPNGYSVNHTDERFVEFAVGMMEIGVVRGFYHFHRKSYNPYRQAEHFLDVISRIDVLPSDFLILDVEEGGERAAQLWAWFETVKKAYPNNRLILYSRKNILDSIYMTSAEKEYFKKIRTWTAGYPYFPDLFSKPPSGYIPDQSKYGETVLWQYSESGVVEGIKGSVDLNWMKPEFYSALGDNTMAEETISFAGKCTDGNNKFWETVGGANTNKTVKDGTSVSGDKRATVSGILYIHVTSPVVGWTKKQWFDVTYGTTPPPPPPPDEPTKTHTIDFYSDGKISVDGSNPY